MKLNQVSVVNNLTQKKNNVSFGISLKAHPSVYGLTPGYSNPALFAIKRVSEDLSKKEPLSGNAFVRFKHYKSDSVDSWSMVVEKARTFLEILTRKPKRKEELSITPMKETGEIQKWLKEKTLALFK